MANLIQGAMYQGQFLPEQEYIEAVSKLIRVDKDIIVNELLNISKAIQVSPQAAYLAWERFSTQIFANPKTQLLSVINFMGTSQQQQWVFANEEYAIQPDGLINVDKIGETIRHEYHSTILTQHLSNMFKTINTKKISKSAIMYLSNKYGYYIINSSKGLPTYRDAFWNKSEQGWKMRGQVAEAFLTHLSKIHLSNIPSKGLSIDFSNQSIIQSEGIYGFAELLYNAKNKDAWYRGGDLIVTNHKGEVIANIQLKTSLGSGSAIGRIKTASLEKQINLLLTKINSPIEMAKEFFNSLKTSAIETQLDYTIEKEGLSVVEKMLKQFDKS